VHSLDSVRGDYTTSIIRSFLTLWVDCASVANVFMVCFVFFKQTVLFLFCLCFSRVVWSCPAVSMIESYVYGCSSYDMWLIG
jgi:hypothetical protein